MRAKHFIIMLMLLFIPLCNAQTHINPRNANEDDTFTFKYFNDFLEKFSDILNKMVFDNPEYLNNSIDVFKNMEKTREEIIIYKSNNIGSKAEYVIPPFYEFSKELKHLCELNYKLEKDLSKNTTACLYDAKLKTIEINGTINNLEDILCKIENISILKKGNKTLKFDVSDVRKGLELYKKKFSIYHNKTLVGNLSIDVSNKNPIVFENITIYGVGKNGNVVLHIANEENKSYNLTIKNNIFSMRYSFNKTGIYKIYATQNNITSNVIYVNVSRIPTYIVINNNYSFYVGYRAEIIGKLIDYYGKYINNSTIYVNNNPIYVKDGVFNIIEFSQTPIGKKLNLIFKGNEIYKPCSKTIYVEFIKKPVKITIYGEKNNLSVNEPLIIYGNIYGLNKTSDIYIFVNNSLYKIIKAKDKFKTNISFNSSGDYSIYAVYKGDNAHEGCKSNIIDVHVVGKSFIVWVVLAITGLSLVGIGLYRFKTKKPRIQKKEVKMENIEENKEIVEEEKEVIPNDIREAYKYIFNKLTSKYNLPKNLTPRELLNIIKERNIEIYNDLEFITKIHENYVYRGFEINHSLIKEYFKRIDKILREINE